MSEEAPWKLVELSSAPTMLVVFLTSEAIDLETLTSTVAVIPSSAVMVTICEPVFTGTAEKMSLALSMILVLWSV